MRCMLQPYLSSPGPKPKVPKLPRPNPEQVLISSMIQLVPGDRTGVDTKILWVNPYHGSWALGMGKCNVVMVKTQKKSEHGIALH